MQAGGWLGHFPCCLNSPTRVFSSILPFCAWGSEVWRSSMMVTIAKTRADTCASECFLRATFPGPLAWVIVTFPTPTFKTALLLSKRHTRKRWWRQDLPPGHCSHRAGRNAEEHYPLAQAHTGPCREAVTQSPLHQIPACTLRRLFLECSI